jgi:BirA family biotin operon repressor/biotin-[acetyl-CoA-carboxylase] ligase
MNSLDTINFQRLRQLLDLHLLEHYDTIGSTQDRAHELARARPAESDSHRPLLIVAEQQTAGRGRGGNQWWTGPGSLAFSAVLNPAAYQLSPLPQPSVSLVVAVAIVRVVQLRLAQHIPGLHWPNDVFVAGRKLSGVLVDVLPDGRYILGVGLNVNNSFAAAPDEVKRRGVSILDLTATSIDRTELLAELMIAMETSLCQFAAAPESFGEQFNELCLQRGADLVVETSGRRTMGRCLGVAPDGALLLETLQGPERIYSGVLR